MIVEKWSYETRSEQISMDSNEFLVGEWKENMERVTGIPVQVTQRGCRFDKQISCHPIVHQTDCSVQKINRSVGMSTRELQIWMTGIEPNVKVFKLFQAMRP